MAEAIEDGWAKPDIDTFMRATVQPWHSPRSSERINGAMHEPSQEIIPPVREAEPAAPVTVPKTYHVNEGWLNELVYDEKGAVKAGVTKNWSMMLEHHPELQGVFMFDEFKRCVMVMRQPPWHRSGTFEPRVLRDADYSEAVMWLETHYMTPKVSNITAVIQTVAENNAFDRLTEYLTELDWDGTARVEGFLSTHMGAVDNAYHRTVAKRWLISAIARALKPGCKVDTMPVFEGTQGAFKSTALRKLFGDEFFTDELSDIGSKDASMEMQGVWCIEVAEMHRFNASDANQVKKFLTRQVDRYRPPYGRTVIEAPRRVLLGGTMNPEGNPYLKDSTGARRFWPVVVGRVDLAKIEKDRDQIWAEAREMFLAGEPWWVQSDEADAVLDEQDKRIDVDAWTSLIAPALRTRTEIAQWDIFELVGLAKKDVDTRHSARVGRIMKRLGWDAVRDRADGEDRIVYQGPSLLGAADNTVDDGGW